MLPVFIREGKTAFNKMLPSTPTSVDAVPFDIICGTASVMVVHQYVQTLSGSIHDISQRAVSFPATYDAYPSWKTLAFPGVGRTTLPLPEG